MNLDETMKEIETENSKKNFRNWINNLIPSNGTSYNTYYILLHPWELFFHWGREIKYASQRVSRGWDDRVIWSIDYHLAKMIPVWIKELEKNKLGIPCDMFLDTDWDEEKSEYKEGTEEIAQKKWHDILDKIALGFESYKIIQDESLWKEDPEYAELDAKYKEGMYLFAKHFSSLWD